MITIVAWKWHDPKYGHALSPEYYNVLYAMLHRNISPTMDWRLVVIGDSRSGLSSEIDFLPLPLSKAVPARNPFGDKFPSCYQRLWLFSQEAELLGPRVINIDVDAVIVGNIDHILLRSETFVGWTDPAFKWKKVAGGLYSLNTGAHTDVWDRFDPLRSPRIAKDAGMFGSDQGWMSYCLYPPPGEFTRRDGAYYAKWLPHGGKELNDEARIIQTPGDLKPWNQHAHRAYPWMRKHWRA
ncbi:MAG: hypothetical protein ACRCV5_06565 [Afipia sp.]